VKRYDLAFLRGNEADMKRAVESAKTNSFEPILYLIKGDSECAGGKIQNARQSFSHGASLAQTSGMMELSAALQGLAASCEAEVGNRALARQKAAEVLAHSNDQNARAMAAGVLARAGEERGSQKVIDELAKKYPSDTLLNAVWLPTTRATNQIRADQAGQAVDTLEAAAPYELGSPPNGASYWPMYVRGEAYLHLRNGAKAAVEYQKILDRRGIDPTSPLYPLARLGLGRAYTLQGDKTKAKAAYQDFFAAWKDADPDVPVLKEAKAEYAELQ
jgi:tetratricopeptide (TPR) repeat protein